MSDTPIEVRNQVIALHCHAKNGEGNSERLECLQEFSAQNCEDMA